MKASKLKCPECGAVPDSNSYRFQLVEPAVAIRRLAIEVNEEGEIEQIQTTDLEHDDADGDNFIEHIGCGGRIQAPLDFWHYDIYG